MCTRIKNSGFSYSVLVFLSLFVCSSALPCYPLEVLGRWINGLTGGQSTGYFVDTPVSKFGLITFRFPHPIRYQAKGSSDGRIHLWRLGTKLRQENSKVEIAPDGEVFERSGIWSQEEIVEALSHIRTILAENAERERNIEQSWQPMGHNLSPNQLPDFKRASFRLLPDKTYYVGEKDSKGVISIWRLDRDKSSLGRRLGPIKPNASRFISPDFVIQTDGHIKFTNAVWSREEVEAAIAGLKSALESK